MQLINDCSYCLHFPDTISEDVPAGKMFRLECFECHKSGPLCGDESHAIVEWNHINESCPPEHYRS